MPQTLNVDGVPGLPTVFSHGLTLPATAQLVYCSGQIHSENGPGGMIVINGSTADKTKLIIGNLERVLKAGGSSLGQPPRTCVCVKELPFGAQIEIECIGWAES
ncbi:BQ2448_345 [Microbotryum intermedium]|uniref:BQ2448_345 protein n=1 Tax=Microbotryum intermedium TaxID=269621 RepID=A0A238F8M3_9BASI|nr:BQ2448_345 [Microbotryum intermedium]